MIGSQFVEESFLNSDWLLIWPIKDATRLQKLWKLIGKGVLNFFGSRFFDRRKDKLIFDDNNQKTQWEKDFKLLAPENWTNGQLKNLADFSKMWITARIFRCPPRTVRYHSCHGPWTLVMRMGWITGHLLKLKIQNILDCRFNLVSLFYFLLRFHWLHFLQLFWIFSKFERMQNSWQSIQKEPPRRKFSPYSTSFDLRFTQDDLWLNVNWEF